MAGTLGRSQKWCIAADIEAIRWTPCTARREWESDISRLRWPSAGPNGILHQGVESSQSGRHPVWPNDHPPRSATAPARPLARPGGPIHWPTWRLSVRTLELSHCMSMYVCPWLSRPWHTISSTDTDDSQYIDSPFNCLPTSGNRAPTSGYIRILILINDRLQYIRVAGWLLWHCYGRPHPTSLSRSPSRSLYRSLARADIHCLLKPVTAATCCWYCITIDRNDLSLQHPHVALALVITGHSSPLQLPASATRRETRVSRLQSPYYSNISPVWFLQCNTGHVTVLRVYSIILRIRRPHYSLNHSVAK